MSIKTIRCRLVASESTRKALWELMAGKNTPLMNNVLALVSSDTNFDSWRQKGEIPASIIKNYINTLKHEPQFAGQPWWCYASSEKQATRIFDNWLATQKQLQSKLNGKEQWLSVLQPDSELASQASCTLAALRRLASQINKQGLTFNQLFNLYTTVQVLKQRAAIAYLLKRQGKLEPNEEDPEQIARKRRKTEISIQRLKKQIQARVPKGRDLTGSEYTAALDECIQTAITTDEEYEAWQGKLTAKTVSVPFPLICESSEVLKWSQTSSGRIVVKFSGLHGLSFDIYCDKTHLRWFSRFLADQEVKKASGGKHSAALFTLRSATLLWRPNKHPSKGDPWSTNYLELHCTVDTRLWTAEGTEQVRREKSTEVEKILTEIGSKDSLSNNQLVYIKRKQATLTRLQGNFDRPHQSPYCGDPDISVGISMVLDKPVTLAIVNLKTGQVSAYRTTRQLLGSNYCLLGRRRKEQERASHRAHINRARHRSDYHTYKESQVGTQIDHLLACSIIEVAMQYKASSIVLPDLEYIREVVEAEIKERAERRIPDYSEGQKRYAKEYRKKVHSWSYRRLHNFIKNKCEAVGIAIEVQRQETIGTPQQKARKLVEKAYANRCFVA